MAVRVFDQSESQPSRLTVVESAPPRRQDVRRTRRHWQVVGAIALAAPFIVAVITLEVAH